MEHSNTELTGLAQPQRRLGPLVVSATGLGCMGLSQGYGDTAPDRAGAAVRAALDAGVTHFDTAMSYGTGANERLVGEALRAAGTEGARASIATKVGIRRDGDAVRLDAHPARIREYALASMARLGRDVIDLYYLHRVDPAVPLNEQVGAMAELMGEGLVRAIGLSEVTPSQLRTAASVAPIAAVQLEWSLAWREPEDDVVPAARQLGISLVPYSSLGRGLLTASQNSRDPSRSPFRGNDPRFQGDALAKNGRAADRLVDLATRVGVEPARLALAWLLHQGNDVIPIPGSRDVERVRANAAAANLTLDETTLGELDSIAAAFVGHRHSFAVPVTERRG